MTATTIDKFTYAPVTAVVGTNGFNRADASAEAVTIELTSYVSASIGGPGSITDRTTYVSGTGVPAGSVVTYVDSPPFGPYAGKTRVSSSFAVGESGPADGATLTFTMAATFVNDAIPTANAVHDHVSERLIDYLTTAEADAAYPRISDAFGGWQQGIPASWGEQGTLLDRLSNDAQTPLHWNHLIKSSDALFKLGRAHFSVTGMSVNGYLDDDPTDHPSMTMFAPGMTTAEKGQLKDKLVVGALFVAGPWSASDPRNSTYSETSSSGKVTGFTAQNDINVEMTSQGGINTSDAVHFYYDPPATPSGAPPANWSDLLTEVPSEYQTKAENDSAYHPLSTVDASTTQNSTNLISSGAVYASFVSCIGQGMVDQNETFDNLQGSQLATKTQILSKLPTGATPSSWSDLLTSSDVPAGTMPSNWNETLTLGSLPLGTKPTNWSDLLTEVPGEYQTKEESDAVYPRISTDWGGVTRALPSEWGVDPRNPKNDARTPLNWNHVVKTTDGLYKLNRSYFTTTGITVPGLLDYATPTYPYVVVATPNASSAEAYALKKKLCIGAQLMAYWDSTDSRYSSYSGELSTAGTVTEISSTGIGVTMSSYPPIVATDIVYVVYDLPSGAPPVNWSDMLTEVPGEYQTKVENDAAYHPLSTIDASTTQNSTNLISSGAVYASFVSCLGQGMVDQSETFDNLQGSQLATKTQILSKLPTGATPSAWSDLLTASDVPAGTMPSNWNETLTLSSLPLGTKPTNWSDLLTASDVPAGTVPANWSDIGSGGGGGGLSEVPSEYQTKAESDATLDYVLGYSHDRGRLIADLRGWTPSTKIADIDAYGGTNRCWGDVIIVEAYSSIAAGRVVSIVDFDDTSTRIQCRYVDYGMSESQASALPLGVSQNNATAGEAVRVCIRGATSVVFAASTSSINRGANLYVADDNGNVRQGSINSNKGWIGMALAGGSYSAGDPILCWVGGGHFENY